MAIGGKILSSFTGGGKSLVTIKKSVKDWFFDRPKILAAMDAATNKALDAAAATIQTAARRSMRYVTAASARKKAGKPYTPSAPGTPPRAVKPHPWVRKKLYRYYDPRIKQAVVGPEILPGGGTDAPHTLEFGGAVKIKNKRRRIRKIGGGGEIRIGGTSSATSKAAVDHSGIRQMVTYCKLKTAEQVERANRLNEQLYGDAEFVRRRVAARPFMGPALAANIGSIAKQWHSSIRGA